MTRRRRAPASTWVRRSRAASDRTLASGRSGRAALVGGAPAARSRGGRDGAAPGRQQRRRRAPAPVAAADRRRRARAERGPAFERYGELGVSAALLSERALDLATSSSQTGLELGVRIAAGVHASARALGALRRALRRAGPDPPGDLRAPARPVGHTPLFWIGATAGASLDCSDARARIAATSSCWRRSPPAAASSTSAPICSGRRGSRPATSASGPASPAAKRRRSPMPPNIDRGVERAAAHRQPTPPSSPSTPAATATQQNAVLSRVGGLPAEAYYSAWYYLPCSVTVGTFWVIFKFRMRTNADDPTRPRALRPGSRQMPSGEMSLILYNHRTAGRRSRSTSRTRSCRSDLVPDRVVLSHMPTTTRAG